MEVEPFNSDPVFTEFTAKKKRLKLKIPKRIQTENLVKCVIGGICVISILFIMISFIMKSFEVSSLQKQFLKLKIDIPYKKENMIHSQMNKMNRLNLINKIKMI